MAIGLARMFGVRLPLNFNSPYKATSIIDFWRRWHITLSRFLRDYLYIPLGGSRKGEARRLANLLITMLLGGLWHGAGWTFVLWGGLHGGYLVVNHIWRKWRASCGCGQGTPLGQFFAWLLTMLAVILAWIPFRAEGMVATQNMLGAMFGFNGFSLPVSLTGKLGLNEPLLISFGAVFQGMFHNGLANWTHGAAMIFLLTMIAVVAPNTQQIMQKYHPVLEVYNGEIQKFKFKLTQWQPTVLWAISTGSLFLISLAYLTRASEFLYFQF